MNTVGIIPTLVNSLFCSFLFKLSLTGKILGIYIKNFYPHLHVQFEQLLDASYNVCHRLNDEEKISLATFLEEINREV